MPVDGSGLKARKESASRVQLLSVIVLAFNERVNVTNLFKKPDTALTGIDSEVIFVDNSPDGTSSAASPHRTRASAAMSRQGRGKGGLPPLRSRMKNVRLAAWTLPKPFAMTK